MKRIAIPAVSLLLLLSCAPPPYNDDFSVSAAVLGGLTAESVSVGPFAEEDVDATFTPEKLAGSGPSFQSGFVTLNHPGWSDLGFARRGQNGSYKPSMLIGVANAGVGSDYPFFLQRAVPAADVLAISYLDPYFAQNNTLSFVGYDATSDTIAIAATIPLLQFAGFSGANMNPPPIVVGGGILPGAPADADWAYWLIRIPAADLYAERATPLIQSASSQVVSDALELSFMPAALNRCLYYHDPLRAPYASYACFTSTGGWQTWKWTVDASGVATPTQIQISGRVDALLTNGDLLAIDEAKDMLRIYDPSGSGTQVGSRPLGNLRFAFEAYRDGAARVFFAQELMIDRQVFLKFYSIETSQLVGAR